MEHNDLVSIRTGIDMRLHAYAPGGISRYARRLARAIARFFAPGSLRLIHHRRDTVYLDLPGAHSYAAWTPPHHMLERWTLGTELLPFKLDIFHATDFIPPAWGARHMVVTIHDLNFLYYPQYLTDSARRYYNDQINWAVDHADAIIVDSAATRDDLRIKLGVPEGHMTVVHLAADARFTKLPEEDVSVVLQHYGLRAGYVLFVGTWEPRKNLPGLLEAFAQVRAGREDPILVIAGRPGWLYEDIYQRIQALHLEASVRFIKQPSPAHLVALYNGASVLILPSFYEGFGLPVLEAMQCGTPVIASNRACLPEVVGQAGLLFDPDDTAALAEGLRRILHDASLRQELIHRGLERVQRFSWETSARQTLQVYKRVVRDVSH